MRYLTPTGAISEEGVRALEDAVAEAKSYVATKGPLIIADYADNPGGGGYGDPRGRDPERLDRDRADGLVTPDAAATRYRRPAGKDVAA